MADVVAPYGLSGLVKKGSGGTAPPPAAELSDADLDKLAAQHGELSDADLDRMESAPPAAPVHFDKATSFGLAATNLFGAGPAISGAVQHFVNGRPYEEARDEYRRAIEANDADESNKWARRAGKVIDFAAETVVGGGVGKAAGAAASLIPGAVKAGTAIAKAAPVVTATAKGAAGGAAYGAANAAGETVSAGGNVFDAAKRGALVGGVAGGALGLGAKAVANAVKNLHHSAVEGAKTWVTRDLVGTLKPSELDEVSRVVLADKALNKAVNKAADQSPEALAKLREAIGVKLADTSAELAGKWKQAVGSLAESLTSGKLTGHIDEAVAKLESSALTEHAGDASALKAIGERVGKASSYGAKTVNVANAADQAEIARLTAIRNNTRNPAAVKKLDERLAELAAQGTPTKIFDKAHVVGPEQIQALIDDAAASGKTGAATHLRGLRDKVLAEVAKTDAGAAESLRNTLLHHDALKAMEGTVAKRFEAAAAAAPPDKVGGVMGFAKDIKKHGVVATVAGRGIEAVANRGPALQQSLARRGPVANPFADAMARLTSAAEAGNPRAKRLAAAMAKQGIQQAPNAAVGKTTASTLGASP